MKDKLLTKKQVKALLHFFGLNYSDNYNRILQTLLTDPDVWMNFQTLHALSGVNNRTTLCRSLTSLEDHNIVERRYNGFYSQEKGAPHTTREIHLTDDFMDAYNELLQDED